MIIESDSLKEFRYIDKLIQLAREGTKQTAISGSNPLGYGMRVYVKPKSKLMSAYINKITRKLDAIVQVYKDEIIKTETPENNQGYGFLSSGRKNKHTLKNGNVLSEGLSFSCSKGATIGYACLRNKDGDLIKTLL